MQNTEIHLIINSELNTESIIINHLINQSHKFFGRKTNDLLALENASLHLQKSSVGSVGFIVQNVNLFVQIVILFVLLPITALDLFC